MKGPACASYATKPYKFVGFRAMDVTKPYEFIRFGAMDALTIVLSSQQRACPGQTT